MTAIMKQPATTATVPENIRILMSITRMSQQDVADEVGVSRTLVSTWVLGKNTPDVYQAAALAEAFSVPMDVLTEVNSGEITREWLAKVRKIHHAIDRLGLDESYRRLLGMKP